MKTRILACLLSVLMLVSMIPVSVSAAESTAWDGTADDSWYNDTDTEFTLTTAEQLAGLAKLVDGGNTFAGKTIKLGADIDLYHREQPTAEPTTFDPIGDKATAFEGIFDGQGKTISNLFQSGWALGFDWYNYGPIGLFAKVNNATIKNLTVSGFETYVEGGNTGGIAGLAYGETTFENITVANCKIATYNNRAAGIVGYTGAGVYTFKSIKIDKDTVIAGLWGSFDSSLGGVVGTLNASATASFKDVLVECRIDAYNDVTAAYKYYAYRMCGMLIGRVQVDNNKNPDPAASGVVCDNVTVTYGDWANYTYINTPDSGWKRAEPGYAYDGVDITKYPDADIITDKPFDQLFGGEQYGSYGKPEYTNTDVHYINEETIAQGEYVLQSDEFGHWYTPATSRSAVKLLYTEHYDEADPKLISGENSHYHECDVCGTAFDHEEHTPEAGWRNNPSGHWHYCTVCKGTYAFDNHEESDWIIDTDAEVGVEGAQHKECKICGYSPLAEETIPALKPAFDGALLALVARYAQRFDVTVIAENVTVTGDTTIKYKRSGIVEIAPAEGYEIVEVIANGISLGATDKVEFKKVMANPTLVVITAPVAPAEEVEEVEPETTEPTEEVEVVDADATDLSAAE